MPVIGTAGHVDHGKSTLVRALTGRDPDRWEEEKRRGLTIDLGFAWTSLPSGVEVGFVDVPGHERFIKNMLAGVDAITVALLVVAADEGWMPQSEEHLAVLDLLDIDHGVVALTRADLVDEDMLELATLEVDDRLAGTALEGSPIIPTAAPDGRGIDELRAELDRALAASPVRDRGRPRMWVDRSFSIAGAGTVLTGTLVDGSLAVDDTVHVYPDGLDGRIRSIQSHERSVDSVAAGTRAAVNIAGLDRAEVGRGAMLGRRDEWALSARFAADLRTVRGLGSPLRERGSYHLHLGSGSWPIRLRLLSGEELDGTGAVIIQTDDPLPIVWGDRFILREVGRRAVVAGGRILDPEPPRRGRTAAAALDGIRDVTDPDEAAQALLEARGLASPSVLSAQTGGGIPRDGVVAGASMYSHMRAATLMERAREVVDGFHADNPLRAGIPKASLATHLGIGGAELEALLDTGDDLEQIGSEVRRSGFGVDLGDGDRTIWESAAAALRDAGFSPPTRSDLGLSRELEHALIRSGDLVEVSADFLYLPEILDAIVERTRSIPDGFTVSGFRDALEITRKHAVPLVEWLDRTGITVREGDVRRTV
jgi:selenocysteine-specific elongation factor